MSLAAAKKGVPIEILANVTLKLPGKPQVSAGLGASEDKRQPLRREYLVRMISV